MDPPSPSSMLTARVNLSASTQAFNKLANFEEGFPKGRTRKRTKTSVQAIHKYKWIDRVLPIFSTMYGPLLGVVSPKKKAWEISRVMRRKF